jgi:hypothetical protein
VPDSPPRDVSDGTTLGTGDNRVNGLDISALGSAYGTASGDSLYRSWLDVGPTVDRGVTSRPLTDNVIEFEDLILFAINYGVVGMTGPAPDPAPANVVTLVAGDLPPVGGTFEAVVKLAADGTLQGLSVPVAWREGTVALRGFEAGDLLGVQSGTALLLSPRPGTYDAAIFGPRSRGLSGEGDLVRLRFEVLAAGDPGLRLGPAIGRTPANEPVVLETSVATPPLLPAAFALHQARPNPFNPVTTIRFDLPRPSRVKLVVFDVAGRAVATLVDEEKPAGTHVVIWNGADRHGGAAASGVYFYRLETGDFVATRKMVLVR